jgi:hypothetical protein
MTRRAKESLREKTGSISSGKRLRYEGRLFAVF